MAKTRDEDILDKTKKGYLLGRIYMPVPIPKIDYLWWGVEKDDEVIIIEVKYAYQEKLIAKIGKVGNPNQDISDNAIRIKIGNEYCWATKIQKVIKKNA